MSTQKGSEETVAPLGANFSRRGRRNRGCGYVGAVTLSASEAQAATFDAEFDIVVCGGGGAGLPAALFSRWLGNKVIVLEKAATLGGTSFKAAYWYWVPNNVAMQKAGIPDSKSHFLKYVARLTQPQYFDANNPRYGLSGGIQRNARQSTTARR